MSDASGIRLVLGGAERDEASERSESVLGEVSELVVRRRRVGDSGTSAVVEWRCVSASGSGDEYDGAGESGIGSWKKIGRASCRERES